MPKPKQVEYLSTKCIFNCGIDRKHRFRLERIWDFSQPLCVFIGLNPSTADETDPDNTVTRCINFARRWGFGGMVMLNAFSFRATRPSDLKRAWFPGNGNGNDQIILKTLRQENVTRIVLCWGSHVSYLNRGKEVRALLQPFLDKCYVFRWNQDGEPGHPLYLPNNIRLKKVTKL